VVYERLKVRQEAAIPENKSDADWDVYQRMRATAEEMRRNHYAVDTSRDITPVLDKVVREVRR
jgi:predicted kinase